MPLYIECPSGHRLKVPRKRAGQRVLCPVCNRGISVPGVPPTDGDPQTVLPQVIEEESSDPIDPSSDEPHLAEVPVKTSPPAPEPPQSTFIEAQGFNDALTDSPAPGLFSVRDPAAPPTPSSPAEDVSTQSRRDFEANNQPLGRSEEDEEETAWSANRPPMDVTTNDTEITQTDPLHSAQEKSSQTASELPFILQLEQDTPRSSHYRMSKRENDPLRDQRWGVVALAVALSFVAIFSAVPSIIEHVVARQVGLRPPDAWTYLVLLGSTIQIAIAFYTVRLPDWSTAWVASVTATGFAAVYALALALTMFASQEHTLLQALGLLDEAFRWQAQPWCFFVMCITLILAYGYGRFSLRWQQLEQQLVAAQDRR